MTREEAIRKAGALLRLAARGGTVAEAATAAAHAEEILARYELTRELVAGVGQEPEEALASFYEVPEGEIDSNARMIRWRWELASRLATMHGAFCFQARRGKGASIEIVGKPGAVETVRYLYAWIAAEVSSLTERHGRGMGTTWRNNFALGAGQEIARRLKAQREETAKAVTQEQAHNPQALVLVKNAIARLQTDAVEAREMGYKAHRLRASGGGGGSRYNPSAREAGRAAGAGVNLGHGARRIGGAS